MEFRKFTAGKNDDGRRLDRILRIFLKDLSLGDIYKLLRKGLIKLNDKKAKADSHVNEGDEISIAEFLFSSSASSSSIKPEIKKNIPDLNIVFENEDLLIINKPYGKSVHVSEKAIDCGLDKEVLAYYEAKKREMSSASISFRPGPLHRLDRNTTGLLVFSMSLKGAHWFSEGIKNHIVQKKYSGLAEGNLSTTETWEDRLSDSEITEEGFHTVSQNASGQKAITIVKPLAHGLLDQKEVTLVEYTIKTGRKHQIRAQSKIHKFPLVGDKAYGGHQNKKLKREYYLEAFSLIFPADNPLKLPEEIKINLSDDFASLLQYCEIKNPGL